MAAKKKTKKKTRTKLQQSRDWLKMYPNNHGIRSSKIVIDDVKVYKINPRFIESPAVCYNPIEKTIAQLSKTAFARAKKNGFACYDYINCQKLIAIPRAKKLNLSDENGIIHLDDKKNPLVWFVLSYRHFPDTMRIEYKYYTKNGNYVYKLETLSMAIFKAKKSLSS